MDKAVTYLFGETCVSKLLNVTNTTRKDKSKKGIKSRNHFLGLFFLHLYHVRYLLLQEELLTLENTHYLMTSEECNQIRKQSEEENKLGLAYK